MRIEVELPDDLVARWQDVKDAVDKLEYFSEGLAELNRKGIGRAAGVLERAMARTIAEDFGRRATEMLPDVLRGIGW